MERLPWIRGLRLQLSRITRPAGERLGRVRLQERDAVQTHLECWQEVMRGVLLLRAACRSPQKTLLLLLRHGP